MIRQTYHWAVGDHDFSLLPEPPGWWLQGPGPALRLSVEELDALGEVLDRVRAKQAAKKATRPRAGRPWDAAEDEQLRAEYVDGLTLTELADAHGRTRGAIAARLVHLGLVGTSDDRRRWPAPTPSKPQT